MTTATFVARGTKWGAAPLYTLERAQLNPPRGEKPGFDDLVSQVAQPSFDDELGIGPYGVSSGDCGDGSGITSFSWTMMLWNALPVFA